MRRITIIAALLVALGGGGLQAQDADPAIRSVITRQIEALKVDDFETAFSFASPSIQRMFGGADRFGEMVRDGYPMVWRPADVRFSGLSSRNGRTVQSVVVTDGAGALYVLDYDMVQDDGGWRINGVSVRRTGDAGA